MPLDGAYRSDERTHVQEYGAMTVEIEFYSPKTLAQAWSCSRSHIYDLIAAGKLKRSKWGRSVKIHRTEVERYVEEMKQCAKMATTSEITEASTAPPSTLEESANAGFRLARATARMLKSGSPNSKPS
jgi:excisionase family DNA binding protein